MLGYLPSLARHVLGETLRLPSIATWWCGEPAALEDAIERLDSLVIKPAFPQSGERPVFGKDLADEARLAFIAKLRARPRTCRPGDGQAVTGADLAADRRGQRW